jgi:hypothetical protein
VYSANDFGNKAFKIVLVYLLKVIVINLAFGVLIAFGSCVFFKILLYSSV